VRIVWTRKALQNIDDIKASIAVDNPRRPAAWLIESKLCCSA